MTNEEIEKSGATGRYAKTEFSMGMMTYGGYCIEFKKGGVLNTHMWMHPAREQSVREYIEKHGGQPNRLADGYFDMPYEDSTSLPISDLTSDTK